MKYAILALGLVACSGNGKAPETKGEGAPAPAAAAPAAPADTLETLLAAKDVILIDVRTPMEFQGGHIPGALNIPLSDLSPADAAIGTKDRPVVVYCRSGGRSGQALAQLKAKGYTRVVNGGGYQALAAKMGVELEK